MNFIYFLLIGLAAGFLAGLLRRGEGFGLVGNLVIGVVGAVLGGFLFGLFGLESTSLLGALVTAVVGAVVLLAIVDFISRSRRR